MKITWIVIISFFFVNWSHNSTSILLFLEEYKDAFYEDLDFNTLLLVSLQQQKMYFIQNGELDTTFSISSSKYGEGNTPNSNCTPTGLHKIKKKIGQELQSGTIIENAIPTHRLANILEDSTDTEDDLITSRLLWLNGLEEGINNNSYHRRIYIHGTNEEGLIGTKASHGCIRMLNQDIIALFPKINVDTYVLIINI